MMIDCLLYYNMYIALYKHKRKYYYYIMEEIQHKMNNTDKIYLIGISTVIIYILFKTASK